MSDGKSVNGFSMADSVLHRLVQLLQVAMMTGVDIADPMRQVRMEPSADDPSVLVLTPAYEAQYKDMIAKLEAQADALIAAQAQASTGSGQTLITGA